MSGNMKPHKRYLSHPDQDLCSAQPRFVRGFVNICTETPIWAGIKILFDLYLKRGHNGPPKL